MRRFVWYHSTTVGSLNGSIENEFFVVIIIYLLRLLLSLLLLALDDDDDVILTSLCHRTLVGFKTAKQLDSLTLTHNTVPMQSDRLFVDHKRLLYAQNNDKSFKHFRQKQVISFKFQKRFFTGDQIYVLSVYPTFIWDSNMPNYFWRKHSNCYQKLNISFHYALNAQFISS
jgi:hypothetical protein